MMTKKRFTYGTGNLFDNEMNTFYRIEDSEENIEILSDRLNQLADENERLKSAIKEAIKNERTTLGKSVLTQLAEQLGVKI